ncbi:MAG: DUF1178 family protein [Shimia sp.]
MIRFTLRCDRDHRFESWFASSDAFDGLAAAGHVTCPQCGSTQVEKALMAPDVRPGRGALSTPPDDDPKAKALAALREKVERESDYVGLSFAKEARAMHDGEAAHRPIHGEATAKEAKALIEDGVPVAPLPFVPKRKTH